MAGPQDVSPTVQALKALAAHAVSVAGPTAQAGFALARARAGVSDYAVTRKTEYETQRRSVLDRSSQYGYANTVPSFSEIARLLHQRSLVDLNGEMGLSLNSWNWAKDRLAANGIDMALPGDATAPSDAKDWLEIVRMSATAAPLGDAMRAWNRTRHLGNAEAVSAQREFDFHLQRDGISRDQDRWLLKYPYAHWTPHDAMRLVWLEVVPETERIALFRAAGISHPSDDLYARWMHAGIPAPEQLIEWAQQAVWDDGIAQRFGLDQRFLESDTAKIWATKQGAGYMPDVGNAPPNPQTEWLKLAFRAAARMPTKNEAIMLQRRFRPSDRAAGESVVTGESPWIEDDTRDVLKSEGFSDVVTKNLLALVHEPLQSRTINIVLTSLHKHPELEAYTHDLYNSDVDWVENAFRDQGHREEVARLLAKTYRARAEDAANADRDNNEKKQNAYRHELARKWYMSGLYTDEQAHDALISPDFPDAMAAEEIVLMGRELRLELATVTTKEIREAFLDGKISVAQVGAQLNAAGIAQWRLVQLVQQWVWEKNESRRVLVTREILKLHKEGLIDSGTALVRLVNLGWTEPDAILEVSLIDREIQAATIRAAESATEKQRSLAERKLREEKSELRRKTTEAERLSKLARKTASDVLTAPLEQEELVKTYLAESNADLAAYAKADVKEDDLAKEAIVAKASARYAKWLAAQIKLRAKSKVVENAVGPIDTERISVPPESEGDSDDAGTASPPLDEAPKPDGGTSAPPVA